MLPSRGSGRFSFMPKLSKAARMEMRRAVGNRVVQEPARSTYGRGPICLWPHACFDCRKSWKLTEGASAVCPECRANLHWMGRAFKVPRKSDDEQWAKVRALWAAGFRFYNGERSREGEPFPERLREVEDFIRRNPRHPLRILA